MSRIIIYMLQSAAILAVLYSVFWLFLRKDTFFQVNRFYLLASLALSLTVPLFNFRALAGGATATVAIMLDPVLITPEKVARVTAGHLSWFEIAGAVYLTGVSIFALRFIVQLIQLGFLVRRCRVTRQDGANLVFVDKGYSPFSFFNLIFIRKEYYIDGKLTPVIEHEKIHIRQLHTVDLVFIEIAIILQWFNPFIWLLGRSVKTVHEFLADEGVLKKGFQKTDYQTLILNEAMGLQINNLTNNFNVSLLKTRIKMMTKTRSASWAFIKVGFALPTLIAVVFLFTAGSMNGLSAQNTQQKATQSKDVQQKDQQVQEQKATQVNDGKSTYPVKQESKLYVEEPIFQVVDVMPEYPGGQEAMITFIASNIHYPDAAKKKGTEGTVYVSYVVEKDGAVTHVKLLRGIGDGCDEEATRVVSKMPKWNPGKQNDEAVRVQFTLPIKFALNKDDKPKEKDQK
jgi:TonB family protein